MDASLDGRLRRSTVGSGGQADGDEADCDICAAVHQDLSGTIKISVSRCSSTMGMAGAPLRHRLGHENGNLCGQLTRHYGSRQTCGQGSRRETTREYLAERAPNPRVRIAFRVLVGIGHDQCQVLLGIRAGLGAFRLERNLYREIAAVVECATGQQVLTQSQWAAAPPIRASAVCKTRDHVGHLGVPRDFVPELSVRLALAPLRQLGKAAVGEKGRLYGPIKKPATPKVPGKAAAKAATR